jgi:hypothetical protein
LNATKTVAPIMVPLPVRRQADTDGLRRARCPAPPGGVWTSIGENPADLTDKNDSSDKNNYQMCHFCARLDDRQTVLYKDISPYSTV